MKTVNMHKLIKATPERVFKALTDNRELERWFVHTANVDARPGGAVVMDWAPGVGERGNVIDWEPSRRFSFTWEAFSPTPTTVTFDLKKEDDGTSLTLAHSGIGEGEPWKVYANIAKAWEAHLQDLASWIETGTCPPPGPRGA